MSTPTTTANTAVPATPAVRALADRLGVTLATVVGTGAGGRIRVDDVRAAAPDYSWFPGIAARIADVGSYHRERRARWADEIARGRR